MTSLSELMASFENWERLGREEIRVKVGLYLERLSSAGQMIAKHLIACCGVIALAEPTYAQVELKTYADQDGYLDVQKLTCAQLANTFQEDADYLTAWHSGWYNGLGKKHMMLVDRAKSLEHQIIVHCKANQLSLIHI